MRLLVSVRNAAEASAAVLGGAEVIDAKDPAAGPLGAVDLRAMADISAAVGRSHEVSAALGDASDEATVERDAAAVTKAGAMFVKIGFAGISRPERVSRLILRAVRVSSRVIAVAYADATDSISPAAILDPAAEAGAHGVLLDTAHKRGPGLRELLDARELTAWVSHAHSRGLIVALAGRLGADDLSFVGDAGADIAGVRGAACTGGRNGVISAEKVRVLRERCTTYNPAFGGRHT
jgi:hypothetical protein